MAKVITLSGLDDVMDFATPEALACLESGGIPSWTNAGVMTCEGAGVPEPIAAPVAGTTGVWRNALKYVAVFGGGAGLGYFTMNKRFGTPASAAAGGAAALLALFAFQPGGWLNKGA